MRIKDLFLIRKGKKATESTLENLRYIQIEDLRNDDNLKYAAKNNNNVICYENDILIAWDGANAGTIGYGLEGAVGSTLAILRKKTENVFTPYAGRFLQSKFKFLRDNCTGATIPHISRPSLENLLIPLPPLPVQRRIAAILDAADEHRRKTEALIDKYDELAQSIFLEMFGDPVRNENKFPKIKLSSLSKISSGSTPSRNVESYYKGNIPWVKTGEVDGGYITHTEEHLTLKGLQNSSCNIYPSNSILIAMYGQGKTRGKVAMITKEMTTNQACAVIEPSDKYNSKFLFYQLQLLYEDLRQLGRGGNQPNLNVGIIKNYEVLNPNIDLQSNFNSLVSNIEDQKISLIKSLEGSEALFQSLLQRAFRGELVTEDEMGE